MFDLIKKRKRLTIPETQYFIYQLIDGLCYLHNKQIIHREYLCKIFSIKLGNLLINNKMEMKLADFGLATKLEYQGDRKHTVCGTPNYIAPEVIMSSMGLGISGHSYEVDVWSTGVIMYLMLIGKAPFQTTRV
jgi:serine/threonine protein kinase